MGGRWTEQEKEGGGACEHRELTSELGERSGRPENERRRRNGPGGGAADAVKEWTEAATPGAPARFLARGDAARRCGAGGGDGRPRGGRSRRRGAAAVAGRERRARVSGARGKRDGERRGEGVQHRGGSSWSTSWRGGGRPGRAGRRASAAWRQWSHCRHREDAQFAKTPPAIFKYLQRGPTATFTN